MNTPSSGDAVVVYLLSIQFFRRVLVKNEFGVAGIKASIYLI